MLEDFVTGLGEYKSEIDFFVPQSISYDIAQLKKFCEKDPNIVFIFYGGEPLMRIHTMKEIMDNVRAKKFMIQTNGILLNKLEPEYVNRFHTILVSIDGNEELTDFYRGEGTYRKVINNVKLLRNLGFKGEIIARMTVMEQTRINEQVWFLLFNRECPFSSVYWQLDALFWRRDYHKEKVLKWFNGYNREVRKLVDLWVEYMEKKERVLKIYPFVGVTQSLLLNESSKLKCGAGWIEFNIQTDGNISPCPVMAGMKHFYLGNIKDTSPQDLKDSVLVSCSDCNIYGLCGGRCLYANVTKLWGEGGFKLVCGTVENLVNSLKEAPTQNPATDL